MPKSPAAIFSASVRFLGWSMRTSSRASALSVAASGINALRVVLVALAELDIAEVIDHLDGVAHAPQRQRAVLDDQLALQEQFAEPLGRLIESGAGLRDLDHLVLAALLTHLDGKVGRVVAVVVDLLDLPAVFPLALANPVVHIAVVGHVARC